MRSDLFAVATAAVVVCSPLASQGRTVDLTGQPTSSLHEPFTNVGGLAEVSTDVAILTDLIEQRLVRVDLRTGEVRNIGRQGSGPGEWRLAMSVLRGKDGQLMVPDVMLGRMHVVSGDGKITSSTPMTAGTAASAGSPLFVPQGVDNAGRLYYTGAPVSRDGAPVDQVPILRTTLGSKGPPDTLAMIPTGTVFRMDRESPEAEITSSGPKPFSPRVEWSVLPNGGVAIVHHSPYRVEIRTGARPIIGPEVAYTPVPVGKAERDGYREQRRNATGMIVMGGGSQSGVQTRAAPVDGNNIPDTQFPKVLPPFLPGDAVVVAPSGEIWVRRTAPASAPTVTYDIFSPTTGARIGTAKLRPHSRVVAFGQNSAYVVRQDPVDDLLYVERYAI